jgi:hypothetical protein
MYNRCTQYTLIRDRPTNQAQLELNRTYCMNAMGLLGLSPLRSDDTQGSQAGRLDCVSGGQRQLKGGHQT